MKGNIKQLVLQKRCDEIGIEIAEISMQIQLR